MIILLAMSVRHIRAAGDGRWGEVRTSVRKVVGGVPHYVFVNKGYEAIVGLEDGGESAWPVVGCTAECWIADDDDKLRLFVLVYLLARVAIFSPAISGLPFHKMWEAAFKSVREGLFINSVFVEDSVCVGLVSRTASAPYDQICF